MNQYVKVLKCDVSECFNEYNKAAVEKVFFVLVYFFSVTSLSYSVYQQLLLETTEKKY